MMATLTLSSLGAAKSPMYLAPALRDGAADLGGGEGGQAAETGGETTKGFDETAAGGRDRVDSVS